MVNQWPPWEVNSLKGKLDSLTALVDRPSDGGISDEAHAWLCRFLVIRSCGYLEQTVVEVSRAYVRNKSGGLVQSFARSWLERSRNPTPEYLIELIGRFDGAMSDEFRHFMDEDDQRIYREVSFLVDRRNKIAHGLNEGITRSKALQLCEVACEVADWFVLRLNPGR